MASLPIEVVLGFSAVNCDSLKNLCKIVEERAFSSVAGCAAAVVVAGGGSGVSGEPTPRPLLLLLLLLMAPFAGLSFVRL